MQSNRRNNQKVIYHFCNEFSTFFSYRKLIRNCAYISIEIKGKRVPLSHEQLTILKEEYSRSKVLSTDNRIKLAKQMSLDPKRIQQWWYDRRHKDKSLPKQTTSIRRFSHEQLTILETQFNRSKCLSKNDRIKLANQMNLEPRNVYQWWYRRRRKDESLSQMKNQTRRESLSETSTPCSVLSSTSSPSPIPYQWQQPSDETTTPLNCSQFPYGWAHNDNFLSMAYEQQQQQAESYNNYPQNGYESNYFRLNGPTTSHSDENVQNNGTPTLYNTTASHENGNIMANAQFSYSNSPSTKFSIYDILKGSAPADLAIAHDDINTDMTLLDNFNALPTPYQPSPDQYMTQNNFYSQNYFDPYSFSMVGHMTSYSNENAQNNGIGMVYNATVNQANENFI